MTAGDYSLFYESCPSGWGESGIYDSDPWKNNMDSADDPYCYREHIVFGTEGEETRPKNIRVIYIMKIF